MPRNKGPLTSDQPRAMNAARKTHGTGGGRPLSDAPRCPCAANTLTRAKAHGFACCKAAGFCYPVPQRSVDAPAGSRALEWARVLFLPPA